MTDQLIVNSGALHYISVLTIYSIMYYLNKIYIKCNNKHPIENNKWKLQKKQHVKISRNTCEWFKIKIYIAFELINWH